MKSSWRWFGIARGDGGGVGGGGGGGGAGGTGAVAPLTAPVIVRGDVVLFRNLWDVDCRRAL